MKTVIIGGGRGCVSLLSLTSGSFLRELTLDIIGVADINPLAPGLVLADKMNIRTFFDIETCLRIPGIELVIEMTGSDSVLAEIHGLISPGARILDHKTARIFWDLNNAFEEQRWQLKELDKLEKELEKEKYFLQAIFDSINDLVVVIDDRKKIVRANRNFFEFICLDEKDVVGKGLYEILPSEEEENNSPDMEDILSMIINAGKSHAFVKTTVKPTAFNWEITGTPLFGQSGEVEFILLTWHRLKQ